MAKRKDSRQDDKLDSLPPRSRRSGRRLRLTKLEGHRGAPKPIDSKWRRAGAASAEKRLPALSSAQAALGVSDTSPPNAPRQLSGAQDSLCTIRSTVLCSTAQYCNYPPYPLSRPLFALAVDQTHVIYAQTDKECRR